MLFRSRHTRTHSWDDGGSSYTFFHGQRLHGRNAFAHRSGATFDPAYLVYTVGKLAILKLRDDYKRDRREQFTLQEFHDRLLSDGNAPLWVHRQMLLPGDKGKLIK